MTYENEMMCRPRWFPIAAGLGICASALCAVSVYAQVLPAPTPPGAAQKSYVSASIHALPGLQCKLYPTGGAPSAGLEVFIDDDGYARFHAVRATTGDAVTRLTLVARTQPGKPPPTPPI
jgi:hypothetical protein